MQWTPSSIAGVSIVLLWEVWNKSLHVLFFSSKTLCLFNLILFVCYFYARRFFLLAEPGLLIDQTDSMVFRCSVYLFTLPTNTICLINTYLYYWIITYLINLIKPIAKAICLKLSVNIPQPHVLAHTFFFSHAEVYWKW